MRIGFESFDYQDLLDCFSLFRSRTDTRVLYDLLSLLGEVAEKLDLRAALCYLVRTGKLIRQGSRRQGAYALAPGVRTPQLVALKEQKSRQAWDGRWAMVTYDVPTAGNLARRRLARMLRQLGFAPANRSTWLSPYDWLSYMPQVLGDLPEESVVTYVRTEAVISLGTKSIDCSPDLWDLDAVRHDYDHIADACSRTPHGRTRSAQRRRAQTCIHAAQALAATEAADPMLPLEFLPADWPRGRARQVHDALAQRVREDLGMLA